LKYIVKDTTEINDSYGVYSLDSDDNECLVANFNQCSNAELIADVMNVDLSERNWWTVNQTILS
jgi:hypothetical protein